ncbi:MAG: FmdB family transcriptional regulator [Nocardioidaceae bacterium]|nr:MAG: FmdB family transcriptional regulator [Nocardioidaceae bacterium]
MPTYQYACTECDHFFEQFQSFSDDALTVCPECGGKLRKVFNAVGVVFKGSGFYRNDSREPSGKNGKETAKSSDSSSNSSESSAGGSSTGSNSSSSDSGSTGSSASSSSSGAKSGSSTPAA